MRPQRFNKKVISFKRRGRKGYAVFDIVAKNAYGKGLSEKIGFWNPQQSERVFFINGRRLAELVSSGAKVNKRVKFYLSKMSWCYLR